MKRFFLTAFLTAGILYVQAQQLSTPQPSPTQILKQNFGVGSIEVNYSRPGLKGRNFGKDLVPYGQVWRTGANGATTIEFSDDVVIGGIAVAAGKYGLLSIPNENEWVVIITKDLNVSMPAAQYNKEHDVVRVTQSVKKLTEKVETFTINFDAFTNNSCNLQLMWENSLVSIPVSTNTDKMVMDQIDGIFTKDNKPYYAAASYYYENDKDIKKAKEWIDKATSDPANADRYYMFMKKAQIYKKLGDKAGAKVAAEKTVVLATKAKNEEYVKNAQELLKTL